MSNEERIRTHFLVTFTSLVILRILQKLLRKTLSLEDSTMEKIIDSIKEFSITKIDESTYKNNGTGQIINELCKIFGIKLNYEFIKGEYLKKI